jgi:phenylacetate-CoA ligase
VNIYPSAIDAVVRSIAGLVEYRVEVSRRGELAEVSLQVECDEIALALEIERALMSAFSLRIPVTRVTLGTLPRFEMKARRWVTRD